jgi:hypothetical protein
LSIPSDWIVTLCNAVPELWTVSVRPPTDTLVTHVGAKKKSPACTAKLEPLAATAPWSLTGVGRAADAGQVSDDPAALADADAGGAEPLPPDTATSSTPTRWSRTTTT